MKLQLFLLVVVACAANARIYDACTLARELVSRGVQRSQIATWVCIAFRESSYNTAAVGRLNTDGSADHGLWQINDRYWCYPGTGCSTDCAKFEDDDIGDDLACAQRIYTETSGMSGNGFSAWTTYYPYCYGGAADSYISGCGI